MLKLRLRPRDVLRCDVTNTQLTCSCDITWRLTNGWHV